MIDIINFNKLRQYEGWMKKFRLFEEDRRNKLRSSMPYIDPATKKELAKIYESATGGIACGSCDSEWLVRLASEYFETMESFK